MSRSTLLPFLLCAAGSLFAQVDFSTPLVPAPIRDNQYYRESLRLTQLAKDAFEYGDYDASTEYALEAIRQTRLSDEYIALQLKIKEANDAIAAAKSRLDGAAASGAARQFPDEFSRAQGFYNESLAARSARDWDGAIAAANRVIGLVAYIEDSMRNGKPAPLPAQYMVRFWNNTQDCLWNIAGQPWAYGDPHQWRLIYNANKSKLPNPNNPNLVEPGTVLDIPSIRGEARQGLWDGSKTYVPLP